LERSLIDCRQFFYSRAALPALYFAVHVHGVIPRGEILGSISGIKERLHSEKERKQPFLWYRKS